MSIYLTIVMTFFCTICAASSQYSNNSSAFGEEMQQQKTKTITKSLLKKSYEVKNKEDTSALIEKIAQTDDVVIVHKSENLPTPIFIQTLLQFTNRTDSKHFVPIGKKVILSLCRDKNTIEMSVPEVLVVENTEALTKIINASCYNSIYVRLDITKIVEKKELYNTVNEWYNIDPTHRTYEFITPNGCFFSIGVNNNSTYNTVDESTDVSEKENATPRNEQHDISNNTSSTTNIEASLNNIANSNSGFIDINMDLLNKNTVSYIQKWLCDENGNAIANRYMRIIKKQEVDKGLEDYRDSDFIVRIGIKNADNDTQDNIIVIYAKDQSSLINDAVKKLKWNNGVVLYVFVLVAYDDYRKNEIFNKCYWMADHWHDADPRRILTQYANCAMIGPFGCFSATYSVNIGMNGD